MKVALALFVASAVTTPLRAGGAVVGRRAHRKSVTEVDPRGGRGSAVVSSKLIEGIGFAVDEAGEGFAALGKQVEHVGQRPEPVPVIATSPGKTSIKDGPTFRLIRAGRPRADSVLCRQACRRKRQRTAYQRNVLDRTRRQTA